jgi:hypothetical protein
MSPSQVFRILEAEVKCYHCNALGGLLRRAENAQPPVSVFQPAGGAPATVVANLSGLRCARCAGPLFADEFDMTYRYPVDERAMERPRRGRPRKQRERTDQFKSA